MSSQAKRIMGPGCYLIGMSQWAKLRGMETLYENLEGRSRPSISAPPMEPGPLDI
ncbi:hypothetical protein BDW69DRAFT_158345 [Aspergillus filifer]